MKPRNEKCHELYVKWAIKHLLIIRSCLVQLDVGNLNLLDASAALYKEYYKLVKTNPASAEAEEIIHELYPFLKKKIVEKGDFTIEK